MQKPDKLDRLRDAKILVAAIVRHPPESTRHEFVRRIQRSYRKYGTLTEAMRVALSSSSS
jgi:hypothetical protein